jgi:hypothetical protein
VNRPDALHIDLDHDTPGPIDITRPDIWALTPTWGPTATVFVHLIGRRLQHTPGPIRFTINDLCHDLGRINPNKLWAIIERLHSNGRLTITTTNNITMRRYVDHPRPDRRPITLVAVNAR